MPAGVNRQGEAEWKTPMQRRATFYALWLVPTGEAYRAFREIIRALSRRWDTPDFSPHVTLASGRGGSPAENVRRCKELAMCIKSLRIAFSRIEGLDEFYRCLFLKAQECPRLLTAHRCARQVFGHAKHSQFMPHLSLLYGNLTPVVKAGIASEITPQSPRSATMRQLWLVRIHGGPPGWRAVCKLNLAA
jgi:2'-5' RNA ligase